MTRIAPLPSWIIAIALAGCLQLSLAQNPAYVPNSVVGAKVGFSTNFTCQSHGIPINTCLWERVVPAGSEAKTLLLSVPPNARSGETIQSGYAYFGEGLQKGECGISITNVKEDDNGSWTCTLISAKAELYRGVVDLGILRKPDTPKFNPNSLETIVDSDDNRARTPQPSRIVCFSGNGQPAPKFQWFIDEEPLREGLGPINSTIDQNSGITYTFQELINHRFSWRDNGKKLRCIAVHDAFGPNDNREASMGITIQFPPRPANENIGKHVNVRAEIGAEKVLSVNVSANPRPSQVVWTVDNKAIREGENTEKYDALIIREVEPGVWETNLRIKSVEEEDVNKQFLLKVTNPIGNAEFDLVVASDASGSGGLSAGGIVLLILGIAALIIIVALVVVYARAQGLLCFKGDDGTASEKERMDGGSTGGGTGEEPQQQKPGLKLTSRLSALYDNLLNKKKDKPVPTDEESATAAKDKEPTQESSTPTKSAPAAPGTPASIKDAAKPDGDKKNDDIVYAELDLARSGGGGGGNGNPEIQIRASDDKTEYAEIVGVVSASTIDEHKRSPSASNKSGGSATDK